MSNVQFGGFSVAVTREDAGWIVEIKDWVRLTVGLDSTFEVTFQDNAINIEGPSNLALRFSMLKKSRSLRSQR